MNLGNVQTSMGSSYAGLGGLEDSNVVTKV